MQVTAIQRHKLKKFVKELEPFRGRHTELVTVYVPAEYDMVKIINHLAEEQGTASNIKSSSTRKNVTDALERMIQHLRVIGRTPEHGLAVFSGNVAEREGQSDVRVWSIEPPIPLKLRLYRCDKQFVLDPLTEMCSEKEGYGLVVMDKRDAHIAMLRGKTIIPLAKTHSEVPGKFKAGGQCLVKDSIVQLADGCLPKIEDTHNPHIVKSVMINSNLTLQDSPITGKWDVKKDTIYKIITKNPRLEICSSKEHTFFVATEKGIIEKTAEELNEGETLIMPEKIDIKGTTHKIDAKKYYNSFIINKEGQKRLKQKRMKIKLLQRELAKKISVTQTTISSYEIGKIHADRESLKRLCDALRLNFKKFLDDCTKQYMYKDIILPLELNKELAQFLGYFVGDGSVETDRITFFEQRREVALAYQAKFNKFFGTSSSFRFRKDKNYYQIRFTSRPLVRLIMEEFPEIKKTLDTEVPNAVLKSNNNIIASFLKGIFDAEGYIKKRGGIGFGINNKRLAQQIQLLLLRFSILSSLLEYDNRANKYSKNPRFTVIITEKRSLEFFKSNIGFTSLEKFKKLEEVIKNKTDRSYARQLIISGRDIRKIIETSGYNMQLFPKVTNFFRNERMMSKQIFESSVLSNIKDKKLYGKLRAIMNYPLLPVKIMCIEKTNKQADMVDISVKNQNFIANGVLVHNSALRFERQREGAAIQHYKKVGDYMKELFLNNPDIKGIIVGGPGQTKYELVDGDYITDQVKKKIIAVKDIGYTDEFGFQELVDKSEDVLANEEIADEKKIMNKFFETLAKESGKVSYGEKEVFEHLSMGIVDTLLLSEALSDEDIEKFEDEAKKYSTTVKIISTETREGTQLEKMGKVAAILRYSV
ncbi:helix-turn-helix domain-containing protein [Candidatus Woesearchaeota archaeon]|nr:helix-turn-helix domain-containing protein [Candidatus Woesearchaeota archaeon]